MNDIDTFINKARTKGLSDADIRGRLINSGWPAPSIDAALSGDSDLVPPPPPGQTSRSASNRTVNVVDAGFSTSGFEYLIYFISLGIVALATGAMLHNIVDLVSGSSGYNWYGSVTPIASAALIVAAPVFLFFMLRLRKKERANPAVLHDRSRRRAVQWLLVITFLVGISKLIGYVYGLLTIGDSSFYSYEEVSFLNQTLHACVTLGIAGGLFAKYFIEQSRLKNSV